jgi:flagellar assembly factor FliW
VQEGVLKAECPARATSGKVNLEVSLNGIVISNPVIFEYKSSSNQSNNDDACKKLDELLLTSNVNFEDITGVEPLNSTSLPQTQTTTAIQPISSNHNLYLCKDVSCQRILKTLILQKFDHLMSFIHIEDQSSIKSSTAMLTLHKSFTFFEDYLITLVKYLSQRKWNKTSGANSASTITTQCHKLKLLLLFNLYHPIITYTSAKMSAAKEF